MEAIGPGVALQPALQCPNVAGGAEQGGGRGGGLGHRFGIWSLVLEFQQAASGHSASPLCSILLETRWKTPESAGVFQTRATECQRIAHSRKPNALI
jgi:hypothetical protein